MPKSKTDFTNFVDARPNYFPGQFLLEDDFEVEQKYLIDRQKYHRQSLHVSGLVEGLEVEVIKDKQEVQIKSGSGINSNGDLIILKKDTSFSKFAPLTNGELYISYKEEKQVKQQEDFTRWQEVPTIGFAATTPNDGVKLAKISIVNNVLTLDLTVRDYSGIFLPNATGNDLTLRSGGNANPNVAILNGSLTVTGTITGNIDATNINSGVLAVERIPNLSADKITSGTISGNLTVTNVLKIGQDATGGTRDWMTRGISILSDSDNLFIGLKDEGSNREDAVIAWGDDPQDDLRFINVLSGGAANGTEIMRLKPSGNVGIGTVTPSEKLEVSGNLKVTGSLTAGNKITVPGNQKIEFSDTDITNNLKLQLWTGYGLGINGGTLFYAAAGKHSWRDINGNNERMALTTGADGSLTVNGTGTSSFAGNLKVNNVFLGDLGHGSPWAGFSHSSQAGLNSYALLQNSTGTYTLINKKAGDGYIGFRVDNNDRMVINSNGNVGIGTITPSEKLEVNGNLKVTGVITIQGVIQSKGYKIQSFEMGGKTSAAVTLASNNTIALFPGLTRTFTLTTATLVFAYYSIALNGKSSHIVVQLVVDETIQGSTIVGNTEYWGISDLWFGELSAGQHTIEVRYRTPQGGTCTPSLDYQNCVLRVLIFSA